LAELDPVTRAQLEDGNWEIRPKGDLFSKDWILSIDHTGIPANTRWVRFWDLASIDPKYKKKNTNRQAPDWTIGFKLGMSDGCYYIADIIKAQKGPGDIETLIYNTALADGYNCAIRMEEEGGSSGIANTERYARSILRGYDFVGVKPVVSKIERARPVAAACQVGSVFISNRCRLITDFFAQIEGFPAGANDDIVDAFSGAFAYFKPNMGIITPPALFVNNRKSVLDIYNEAEREYTGNSYWRSQMGNR
jgi:predicted phage terminase large subunit-like protein